MFCAGDCSPAVNNSVYSSSMFCLPALNPNIAPMAKINKYGAMSIS